MLFDQQPVSWLVQIFALAATGIITSTQFGVAMITYLIMSIFTTPEDSKAV